MFFDDLPKDNAALITEVITAVYQFQINNMKCLNELQKAINEINTEKGDRLIKGEFSVHMEKSLSMIENLHKHFFEAQK
ncbi:hypothetical protein [Neokomagataea anthophila]|uniref:Uncharacterized protein n=1 Tax=Neokomagataea anthophila TaxID=2826925 RepID=A0ABS5E839_9PROT|nr:hypothetical protein [Neokomagataea anthophila]MBR0560073.1 hypothetical protein [Neokomagataea anthophila]